MKCGARFLFFANGIVVEFDAKSAAIGRNVIWR